MPRDWLGVGLRHVHYPYIYKHWPAIDFFEVISDNFIGAGETHRRWRWRIG